MWKKICCVLLIVICITAASFIFVYNCPEKALGTQNYIEYQLYDAAGDYDNARRIVRNTALVYAVSGNLFMMALYFVITLTKDDDQEYDE